MQFKHILAASIGAACLLLVVFLGLKHSNKTTQLVAEVEAPLRAHEYTWADLMAHFNEETPLPEVIQNQMKDPEHLTISDTSLLNNSIEFCYKNQYYLPAARLQVLKANIAGNNRELVKATETVHTLATMERDSLVRNFLMAEVVDLSSKILSNDANNLKGNLYSALALADKKETMMNAVPHLLAVVRQDENNIPALYTLGLLSIESGQIDKALQRFEKLVSLQPSNPEYHLRLANTFALLGRMEEAKKEYETSRDLSNSEEAKEEINRIISNLK